MSNTNQWKDGDRVWSIKGQIGIDEIELTADDEVRIDGDPNDYYLEVNAYHTRSEAEEAIAKIKTVLKNEEKNKQ